MAHLRISSDAIVTDSEELDQIQRLLTGLNLLGPVSQGDGVAVLESTATNLSKWWAAGVAALGGSAAIYTALTGFWHGLGDGPRVAALAAAGVMLGAAIVSVAMIVCTDLRSRATGQVAIYEARSSIAQRYLELTYDASTDAKLAAVVVPKNGQVKAKR